MPRTASLILLLLLVGCGHALEVLAPPERQIPVSTVSSSLSVVSEPDVVQRLERTGAFANYRGERKRPPLPRFTPDGKVWFPILHDRKPYSRQVTEGPQEVVVDVTVVHHDDMYGPYSDALILGHATLTVLTGCLGGFVYFPYGTISATYELRCADHTGQLITWLNTRAKVAVWHQYFGWSYERDCADLLRERALDDLVARLVEDPRFKAYLAAR
jgi:hypothetical protein